MLSSIDKSLRRKSRVRTRLKNDQSTSNKPNKIRLSVYRSNNNVFAQLINDQLHQTLASVSTLESDFQKQLKFGGNVKAASLVGKLIAERGIAIGIQEVIFDRGPNLYHGRIKALAEAARASGLKF